MTRKTRQVLLALAVTTALCADQVAVATPILRPQVAQLAGQIVNRLSRSFRHVVTVESPLHERDRSPLDRDATVATAPASAAVAHQPLSPFQFRLPPPTL
jgi:hypothetical protein